MLPFSLGDIMVGDDDSVIVIPSDIAYEIADDLNWKMWRAVRVKFTANRYLMDNR